jgi:hypothetical protein
MNSQNLSRPPLPVATPCCSANFCEVSINTWVSPNFPTPPFPGPDSHSLNIRRHASWWDPSVPWLPYTPVFGLHANAHHEFFSISRKGIIFADSFTDAWMTDPVRLAQWQEFFFAVSDICYELRRYLVNVLNWEYPLHPPEVNYKDLLSLRSNSATELATMLSKTHDIMLEWIGYFNWLCVMYDSQVTPPILSEILKTPSFSTFCLYLSKFSNKLRGVCVDFDSDSISVELVQQWIKYNVPCYLITIKAGIKVQKIPFQYTICGMAAHKRTPPSNRLRHYAIEEQGQLLKIWEPPKRTRKNNSNKRSQYLQAFYSSNFYLHEGRVRIYWYKIRRDEFANQHRAFDEIEETRKRNKNPYCILDQNYNSSDDSDHDPMPYYSSSDETHERHQKGAHSLAKLIRPALPPRVDLVVGRSQISHGHPHHVVITAHPVSQPQNTHQVTDNQFVRPETPPPDSFNTPQISSNELISLETLTLDTPTTSHSIEHSTTFDDSNVVFNDIAAIDSRLSSTVRDSNVSSSWMPTAPGPSTRHSPDLAPIISSLPSNTWDLTTSHSWAQQIAEHTPDESLHISHSSRSPRAGNFQRQVESPEVINCKVSTALRFSDPSRLNQPGDTRFYSRRDKRYVRAQHSQPPHRNISIPQNTSNDDCMCEDPTVEQLPSSHRNPSNHSNFLKDDFMWRNTIVEHNSLSQQNSSLQTNSSKNNFVCGSRIIEHTSSSVSSENISHSNSPHRNVSRTGSIAVQHRLDLLSNLNETGSMTKLNPQSPTVCRCQTFSHI